MSYSTGLGPATIIPAIWDVPSAGAAVAAGASHLFVSGGALSNECGYPDNGLLDISDLVQVVRRVKAIAHYPLMVDAETGYGSLHRLARLTHELLEIGVDALMIEDQEETGQSVRAGRPGLCSPQLMSERIKVIREIAGDQIDILARTDCIDGIPFQASLNRLAEYREAGANWLMPVFVPTQEDLALAGTTFDNALFVIVVPSTSGYVPTLEHVREAGAAAVLVTSQNRNVFVATLEAYRLTFEGAWRELRAGQSSAQDLARLLKLNRFEGGQRR